MTAPLIAFSGIDGAGKSTQIDLLMKLIKDTGGKPKYLWSRGGYTVFFNSIKSGIRLILKKKLPSSGHSLKREQIIQNPQVARVWLSLAILDLIFLYGIYIRFQKILGRTVIADRYLTDTQLDFRLNFPTVKVEEWILWKVLKALTPKPDNYFMLLIPVEESIRRSKLKNEPFPDSEEVLTQRHAFYTRIVEDEGCVFLDCTQSIETIHEQIKERLPIHRSE